MAAPAGKRVYDWETAKIGDASAPYSSPVTEEGIAAYCHAARYENLVYTSPAAAREAGFAGVLAPPAMLLALAPLRLEGVAADAGCALPELTGAADSDPPLGKLAVEFGGSMPGPGGVITSVTSVESKYREGGGRFIVFRVSAHNEMGEPVVDYRYTVRWPGVGGRPKGVS